MELEYIIKVGNGTYSLNEIEQPYLNAETRGGFIGVSTHYLVKSIGISEN
jgi:hypothetical protein